MEEAVLERKIPETDLRQLVELPPGLGYEEWLASHSKYLALGFLIRFHVNKCLVLMQADGLETVYRFSKG